MATTDASGTQDVPDLEPRIRPALDVEADAINDLVRAAYEAYTPLIGRTPIPMLTDHAVALREREVFVLVVDDHVIGVLDAEARQDHLWLENVAVHPDHQGRGLGRALLTHAETVGRDHGLAEIRLLTNERYVDNIAMYRRYGYRETHRRPYLGTDLVYFSKPIRTDPDPEPLEVPVTALRKPETALDALREQIEGRVIVPSDPGYDEARRVWNGLIDRRPVAIVEAGSATDVAPTIRLASELGLPLAIRGGGHNVAGNGTVDDGIVLDLGRLNAVDVDPGSREVRVGAGATLRDVDRATEPHGLAVPIGVVSGTGMAGLTLGGGVGWLTRAHGLTVDSLLGAEMVTAAGETVRASETDNPELFWGLRGGGGNFGVVTAFTFRAVAMPPDLFTGSFIYAVDRWDDALRAYAAWTTDLPDPLTSIITFMVPPAAWDLGNDPLLLVGFNWAGPDRSDGERWADRLRDAAGPTVEILDPTPWTTWQSAADELFPQGVRAYWKNTSFDRLDDATIDILVRFGREQTWRGTAFDVHHMGGAFGRVPEDSTPFPNRSAGYWLNVYGFWDDPADDEPRIPWIRQFAAAVEPHASGGQYVNFLGQEVGRDNRQAAMAVYGPAKFERLVALKRRYDPDNLFRLNHNIPPG